MKWLFVLLFTLACTGAGVLWIWKERKYRVADQMTLPVVEYSSAEYPEDPALHALLHNRYKGRVLRLVRKAPGRFDFNFESTNRNVARVSFKDIDVTLFTPRAPEWARRDAGLTRIALVDREWNRQQVAFSARSPHLEVSGGDGVERQRLFSAELANNCLNAGLWEVLLFVEENGQKALYYQGWFTFPRGHYAAMFEANNAAPYRSWWRQMEHWVDPAGTPVNVDRLRAVVAELPERITPHPDESVFAAGEQRRKMRTLNAENVLVWKDYFDGRTVEFATFAKPGRYVVSKPWSNEYRRIATFESGVVRSVRSPAGTNTLRELEFTFTGTGAGQSNRLFVGGLDFAALPVLPVADYPKGLYMPMGLGVPPFYQSYDDLQKAPPHLSAYYNVLLDPAGRWIDHHKLGLDGVCLHRDPAVKELIHVYLLSYERNTLLSHFTISEPNRAALED